MLDKREGWRGEVVVVVVAVSELVDVDATRLEMFMDFLGRGADVDPGDVDVDGIVGGEATDKRMPT
jgi:hypothetical protein